MQLKVLKADKTVEYYMHTKVLHSLYNCLSATGQGDTFIAEELAGAVTFYFYEDRDKSCISTDEIFTAIKATLCATGFEKTAAVLEEHYYKRLAKRNRTQVIDVDVNCGADIKILMGVKNAGLCELWDKSNIVRWIVEKFEMDSDQARAIAGIVEDKIFQTDASFLTTSLIKQCVLIETAMFMQAASQLDEIVEPLREVDQFEDELDEAVEEQVVLI